MAKGVFAGWNTVATLQFNFHGVILNYYFMALSVAMGMAVERRCLSALNMLPIRLSRISACLSFALAPGSQQRFGQLLA